jgi:hypothetical protein
MASTFKTFLNDDIATTRTLLHEAIPITGSIIYGTYGAPGGLQALLSMEPTGHLEQSFK